MKTLLIWVLTILGGCPLFAAEPILAFLYSGPIGDYGWTYSHERARQELPYDSFYVENVNESNIVYVLPLMQRLGANMIFGTSWEFYDALKADAAQHPEITYFVARIEGEPSENMFLYLGRMYQARYLAGLVAGAMTQTNRIGYVAAFPIPEVVRGINAFARGVREVNPEAKIIVRWLFTWYSPPDEIEAAYALIAEGADVLIQHCQSPSVQQISERAGVYAIGYASDMRAFAPHANLTSCIWNWTPLYALLIEKVLSGASGEVVWAGLETGVVGLAPLADCVPKDIRALIQHKIKTGEFEPFPELSDSELLEMQEFEDNVIAP